MIFKTIKFSPNAFALLLMLSLAACNQAPSNPESSLDSPEQQDVSAVLATVNGEAITQNDVEFMINRTFSGADQLFFDDTMQGKVLDSLIASKAMKQSMASSLDADTLLDIQKRTDAFNEELFVKEYLVQHATPQPVSSAMVNDYYERYPEEFGGGESRVFEMLSTANTPNETQRDAILNAVATLKTNSDWAAYAANNELGLVHKKATMRPGLFNSNIENAVKLAALNSASDVVLVNGIPHLIRVLKVSTLPPKPLNEVSAQIRKKLAALQLKKAVKEASATAIANASVTKK